MIALYALEAILRAPIRNFFSEEFNETFLVEIPDVCDLKCVKNTAHINRDLNNIIDAAFIISNTLSLSYIQ